MHLCIIYTPLHVLEAQISDFHLTWSAENFVGDEVG